MRCPENAPAGQNKAPWGTCYVPAGGGKSRKPAKPLLPSFKGLVIGGYMGEFGYVSVTLAKAVSARAEFHPIAGDRFPSGSCSPG